MFTKCAHCRCSSRPKKPVAFFKLKENINPSERLFPGRDAHQKSIHAGPTALECIPYLINKIDSLIEGKAAAARLVQYGVSAIEPLRKFLLDGRPSKIFQPRLLVVNALTYLDAKEVLREYLLQERNFSDPQDRFGEEAVQSAAARAFCKWPDEATFQFLLQLSERRMLQGLIEALAEFRRPETIPYFEQALEDDFYRQAAEAAFQKLGRMARDALVAAAVTPHPDASTETPSSLQRRRSATMLLSKIGAVEDNWSTLRPLIAQPDEQLIVNVSKIGITLASAKDKKLIARRLAQIKSWAPWYLKKEIDDLLAELPREAAAP
jgi:hypothetical protein